LGIFAVVYAKMAKRALRSAKCSLYLESTVDTGDKGVSGKVAWGLERQRTQLELNAV